MCWKSHKIPFGMVFAFSLRVNLYIYPVKRITALYSLLCLAGCPLGLKAQQDSMPEILTLPLDWSQMEPAERSFNNKDAVRFVIGKEHLTAIFDKERNENYLNDFHFVPVNGDASLDLIFSGPLEFYGEHRTYFFVASRERAYPNVFEAPGYLCRLSRRGSWADVVLCRPATDMRPFTFVNKLTVDLDSATSRLTAQVCFLKGTEIPVAGNITAEELRVETPLRTLPFEINEPVMDFEKDGIADAWGNQVVTLPAGCRLIKLAARTTGETTWDFVLALDPPTVVPQGLAELQPGFTFIAGWIPDDQLK